MNEDENAKTAMQKAMEIWEHDARQKEKEYMYQQQKMEADKQMAYQQELARQQMIFSNPYVGTAGATGPAPITIATGAVQEKRPQPIRPGILFAENGEELSPDWRGAKITAFSRTIVNTSFWQITFKSEWSMDEIRLWLPLDDYSGSEVNKAAGTFMEALNQRRLG